MGLMLVGVMFISNISNKGILVILFAHGICSSALFFLVGIFYEKRYSRQMLLQRGNLSLYFNIAVWWFLFLAMNFSAPPFLRLAGEVIVIFHRAAINYIFVGILIMVSFFVAYFCVFLYSRTIHGKTHHQWFLTSLPDFFYLVLLFHIFPNFLMMKLEVFSICLYSLKKIGACGALDDTFYKQFYYSLAYLWCYFVFSDLFLP
jgi:NADH:ubiquinone oxidoreductase subunit 4 (subunit M)